MKIKIALSILVFTFFSKLSGQNCIQITPSNFATINSDINSLSTNGGGCIEITPGEYDFNTLFFYINSEGEKVPKKIELKDNIVIRNYGKLYSTWIVFYISNAKNISIIGDKLGVIEDPNGQNNGNKGILITDSNNINITGLNINNFKNKGIEVVHSTNITIRDNKITGSNSNTGAGIAITDGGKVSNGNYKHGSSLCDVSSNFVSNSRIGITANRSFEVIVNNNIVINNSICGIALDGSVDGEVNGVNLDYGTGSQNCIISNNIVKNNANSDIEICYVDVADIDNDGDTNEIIPGFRQDYSGIYIGNGAQKNMITNNFVKNNYYGISYFEEENFTSTQTSYNNTISNNQVIMNKWVGIKLTRTKSAIVTSNQVISNTLAGIQVHDANISNYTIRNNHLTLNGEYGFFCSGCQNENLAVLSSFNVLTGHTVKDIESLGKEYQNSVLCD
ncbi:hypothetical protein FGF1_34000 [Flavobacteriaceae bacterium GF1]